jgi:hypothetical protein
MTDSTHTGDGQPGRKSKVVRAIERYNLQGIGPQMQELWTTDEGDQRKSLRELAEFFNQRMLQSALEQNDVQPLEGEVENMYRLLQGDGVSKGEQTRTRRRLERDGVDVDQLKEDFVSYQAMRTYLTKYSGEEYNNDTDPHESATETIQQLQSRVRNIAESKLGQLKSGGHISLGEFRVIISVRIFCEKCQTQKDIISLLSEGGCECE